MLVSGGSSGVTWGFGFSIALLRGLVFSLAEDRKLSMGLKGYLFWFWGLVGTREEGVFYS